MYQTKDVMLVSKLLKSLSNSNRLYILCSLIEQPLTVTELTKIHHISQPAISQHLKILLEEEIVTVKKDKKESNYSIKDLRVIDVLNYLKEHFCLNAS